jgi:hypothetical protein
MNFKTGTGRSVDDPTASQLMEELATLAAEAGSYAILSRDALTYLQTSGSTAEGFLLEYQDGSTERHYCSKQRDLPLEAITSAFQRYARDDLSWRSAATWEQHDLGGSAAGSSRLRLALLVVAALAFALWWWRAV